MGYIMIEEVIILKSRIRLLKRENKKLKETIKGLSKTTTTPIETKVPVSVRGG